MTLTALALNCTLKTKRTEDPSSTDRMLKLLATAMEPMGVTTEFLQLADYDIKPGVTSDEGNGDAWPDIDAGSSMPISSSWVRRSGWANLPASASGRWNAWTLFWRKRTTKAG